MRMALLALGLMSGVLCVGSPANAAGPVSLPQMMSVPDGAGVLQEAHCRRYYHCSTRRIIRCRYGRCRTTIVRRCHRC